MTSSVPLVLAYVLIFAGVLLLVAEFFLPTHGVLLVLSLSAVALGVAMTFMYSDDPSTGFITLIAVFVALPTVGGVMLYYWPRTRVGRRFFRLATSSFQTPKSCSKTITLPSALIVGKRTSPVLKEVTRSAFPPASGTRQMLVRPLPSRSLTK